MLPQLTHLFWQLSAHLNEFAFLFSVVHYTFPFNEFKADHTATLELLVEHKLKRWQVLFSDNHGGGHLNVEIGLEVINVYND